MAGKVVSLPLLKRSMTSINISLPCFSLPSFSSDPLSSIFSRLSSHFSKIFQLCLLEYFLPCTLSLYSPFHIRYLLDVSKLWSTSVIRCIIIFFYTAECVFWMDNSGKKFCQSKGIISLGRTDKTANHARWQHRKDKFSNAVQFVILEVPFLILIRLYLTCIGIILNSW